MQKICIASYYQMAFLTHTNKRTAFVVRFLPAVPIDSLSSNILENDFVVLLLSTIGYYYFFFILIVKCAPNCNCIIHVFEYNSCNFYYFSFFFFFGWNFRIYIDLNIVSSIIIIFQVYMQPIHKIHKIFINIKCLSLTSLRILD